MILPPPPIIPSPTINVPTPSLTNLQGSTNVLATLFIRDGPDCANVPRYRTTTNIVLSCLTTILTCTWVALHLDAPKSDKSKWKCFWRRFGWMIFFLIIPEFIASIAIKERLAAKKYMHEWNMNCASLCSPELVEIRGKTSKQYKRELKNKNYDSRWTLTHGFFAGMGGIRLHDDNDKFPKRFIPDAKISEDPRMRSIVQQIGLISAEEIKDKSKGDGMSELIVVAQTTWFIVQCLARWVIHLPVTELEVVTLAYAVQGLFIYTLWWNKPQGLVVPYRLYFEGEPISEDLEVKGESKLEVRSPSATSVRAYFESMTKLRPPPALDYRARIFLYLAVTIFGALHLIPLWLSVFPSDVEKKLWQISAFYTAGWPCALIVGAAIIVAPNVCCHAQLDLVFKLAAVFCICSTAAYVVARIMLLVLSFTTLRSLPKDALLSIEWTRFIPHFQAT